MKELKVPLETKWIKKYIRDPREIENLKYLIRLDQKLIPGIKTITENYYIIEKCKPIGLKDFAPSNFYKLYFSLLAPLYKFKKVNFTAGIYKYFMPHNLNYVIKNQNYIPYLLNELEKIVQSVSFQSPGLLNDISFVNLLRYLKSNSKYFKNWKPLGGYSPLHGDLHIGNIVKRNNNYLLVDFEYLRYGATEIEIANLIISSSLYFYKRDSNNKNLKSLITDYLQVSDEIPSAENDSFRFFFLFSLSLFYLSMYLKNDLFNLKTIQKIIKWFKYLYE